MVVYLSFVLQDEPGEEYKEPHSGRIVLRVLYMQFLWLLWLREYRP